MKQIAWTTALVVATVMVLIGLWRYSSIVVLFLLSLTLAAVLRPFVERLTERGIPRSVAIGLSFVTGALGIAVLLYFSISLLLPDLQQVIHDLGVSYEYIHTHWPEGNALEQAIARRLPPLEKVPQSLADVPPSVVLRNVLGVGLGLFDLGVNILVIVVLSMYWSIDYHRFERLWMSLLPVEERSRARQLWRQIEQEVGVYMRSEVLQSLAAGLVLSLVLSLIRFPYPIAVSILAALAWLLPWIGPALAIAAVWFAVFLGSAESTMAATLGYGLTGSGVMILIFWALEYVVEPRLIDRRRYSSLLIALVALAMAEMVGIIGLILGPPLAVAIQRIMDQYLWQTVYEPEEFPTADIQSLATRLAELRSRVDPEHVLPMSSLLSRVSELLEDSKPLLPSRPRKAPDPPASPGQNGAKPAAVDLDPQQRQSQG